jgi:hypothetical protein
VAGAVADRYLSILDPVDPMGKPADVARSRRVYGWTREVYRAVGADDRFEVMARQPGSDPADAYLHFLNRWRT